MSNVGASQMSSAGAAKAGARAFRLSSVFFVAYLLSMPIYCLVRLSGEEAWIGSSTAFTAISLFAFSLAHCVETRSVRRASLMLVAGSAIALTMEHLGSTYGLIFGHYDYTDKLGPKAFGSVPLIIPIAWFMMLYPAWHVADLLVTRGMAGKTQGARRVTPFVMRVAPPIARIIIAALAMTAWDLSLDPRMVADGNWIWPDGGEYFGIPLSNYAGWFITSALIYCAWHPLIGPSSPALSISNLSSLLPIWAYIVTWLGESVANAVFWGGPAVAAAVFVGMGLFGGPALWILLRRPVSRPEAHSLPTGSLLPHSPPHRRFD